jgi:hypothetical protein
MKSTVVAGDQAVAEPWRDPARPVAERVADLLSRMTLAEKVAQLGRDALQAGQQQDDPEPDVLPGGHHEHRVQHQRGAGQPVVHQAAEARRLQQRVQGSARLQQLVPHHRRRRLGQHERREHGQPQERPAAHPAVQQQRQPDADGQLDDQRQHGDDHVVQQGLVEDRAGQHAGVVLHSDEVVQRPEAAPVVQAVPDGEDHRDDHEPEEQDDRRDEQHGQLDPLAHHAPGPRRAGTGALGARHQWPEPLLTELMMVELLPWPAKKPASALSSA